MSSTTTFGHRTEEPHPEGQEPPEQTGFKLDGEPVPPMIGSLANPGVAIKWIGYGLAVCAGLLAFYDQLRPSPLAAVIMLILPLAVMALLLQSPASFEVASRRVASPSRTINFALVLPFGLLLLPNKFHAQVDWLWPLIPAAVTSLVMSVVAWTLKSRQDLARPTSLVLLVTLCGGLYGYAATALANIQFDTSAGEVVPLLVMDRYRSCGRSCTYKLELPAEGPRPQAGWVEVSSSLYDKVRPGDTVCVTNHPGALTLPWYTTGLCGGTQSSSARTAPWTG